MTSDTVTVRLVVPRNLHAEVNKLGIDLRLSPSATLIEALLMLLRYHDRGYGLPDALPPCPARTYRPDPR